MNLTSLYINIPHEESKSSVCGEDYHFLNNNSPNPTQYLKKKIRLILIGKKYS